MTRAFIIANGPSLNLMNLNPLENEITLGCNTIFDCESVKFPVDYYFCLDSLLAIIIRHEIIKYLDNEKVRTGYIPPSHLSYIQHPKTEGYYQPKQSVGIWMIYKALELGYEPIYVVGMDIDYKFPPLSELNYYLNIQDLPVDAETKRILLELKDEIVFDNIFTFKDNTNEDLSHMNNYLIKKKIPEHHATSANVLSGIRGRYNKILPAENRSKVFNAGIGGNANFLNRVNFESLF